jgi:hypothetical protein
MEHKHVEERWVQLPRTAAILRISEDGYIQLQARVIDEESAQQLGESLSRELKMRIRNKKKKGRRTA